MADQAVGAARAALGQGLGMGWGDEAEAWLRSKLGQGSYEDQLGKIRGEYAQYAKESPFTSGALEFAGGVAPGVAAMFVPGMQPAVGTSTMRAIGKMAGLGALSGGVSGAGSATEGERLGGAGQGAAVGTVVGGAAPVVLRGAGAGAKWLADRLAPTESRITSRAAELLAESARRGKLTPQQIEQAMAADRAAGVPSMLLNVSPSTARRARGVSKIGGEGADILEEALTKQQAGSRERAYGQVKKGLQPGEYYADEQKLVEDLRNRAKGVYDQAYAHGTVDDPRINEVLKNPEFAGFFEKAKAIANKEALAAKLRGEDPSPYQLEEIYKLGKDAQGNVIVESVKLPDVRTLDYMKRGIDATIDNYYSTGKSAEAKGLRDLRKVFVNAIDENAPDYAKARGSYAGDMEVLDAMRAGMSDFGKLDHEQVIKMVSGMSQAEKEAFRTGVSRSLYSKIMEPSGGRNVSQNIIGSPEMQAKLQPLFDNPGQFNLFKNALERESQLFKQANRVLGGSDTAENIALKQQMEGDGIVGQAMSDLAQKGFWNSLTNTAGRVIGKASITEKTATKLANVLVSKGPHEGAAVVKLVEEQAAGAAPKAARAGAAEAGATTGTTSAIWPAPYPQDQPADIEAVDATAAPSGPDIEEDIRQGR